MTFHYARGDDGALEVRKGDKARKDTSAGDMGKVIDAINHGRSMTVEKIAKALGKSTGETERLVADMLTSGYVRKSKTGTYSQGY